MPTTCYVHDNTDTIAIGHGATSKQSGLSEQLNYALFKTMPAKACRRQFPFLLNHNSVLCVHSELFQSIYKGDSGGPLITTANSTLIGVSSFGKIGKKSKMIQI